MAVVVRAWFVLLGFEARRLLKCVLALVLLEPYRLALNHYRF